MGEVERWLTMERVAFSDLAAYVFERVKSDPDWPQDEAAEWMLGIVSDFALGRCFDLAVAVAVENGLSVATLSGPKGLAHAFAVDPATTVAYDVLGARQLAAARRELVAACGPLRLACAAPPDGYLERGEFERLAAVAAALPWMPRPPSRPATPFGEVAGLLGELREIADRG